MTPPEKFEKAARSGVAAEERWVPDVGGGGVGLDHLRRFCRISLTERVPDDSTVRKLTRRIGPETVAEITRAMIVQATREKRFRPRAVRIDSTGIEADVQYPTDAGLASSGVRVLARVMPPCSSPLA